MKNLKIVVSAILLFAVLAGIGYALTPPPPPPPPVPQNLGLYDSAIDSLQTNLTDQGACRQCHLTTGTNLSGVNNGTYNNSVGGVPTRHHSLLPRNVINPSTGFPFGCTDCHPSTPGVGNGILLDRSCVDCHNGTSFWADAAPLNAHVGNFSRPHHVNTSYASSNVGNPAANRTCKTCHGSFVDNYNDNHYKPTYATSLMITPFATFKVTSLVLNPVAIGGNKTWGGCKSCHMANPSAVPSIAKNNETHHKEILGFAAFGGTSSFTNASTPFDLSNAPGGQSCFVCHVINTSSQGLPLYINFTNEFTGELVTGAAEVRNSTVEATGAIDFVSTNGNIMFNGTGCEKCHGVPSLHNIQSNYTQNGPQGKGHINNNSDCSGCHDEWIPANTFVPGPIIPTVDSISPLVIAANTATTLTIAGANFVNDVYTSVVTVDGVTYHPSSITDSQIVVNIPALAAGSHQLQLVKGVDTLSKLSILTVVPVVALSSATLDGVTLTISGTGLGNQPTTNAQQYVTFSHAGKVYYSDSIASWTPTKIVATLSSSVAVATGDVVDVITADSGEQAAPITVTSPPPTSSITVTSPNGGENWKHGTTHVITWTSVGIPPATNVKIELLRGTAATTIKTSTPNSGTWSWNIPSSQPKATNYKIRVTSIGTSSYNDTSNANFQIS